MLRGRKQEGDNGRCLFADKVVKDKAAKICEKMRRAGEIVRRIFLPLVSGFLPRQARQLKVTNEPVL